MKKPIPHLSLPVFLMFLLALCGLTACSTVPDEPMEPVPMPPAYQNNNDQETTPEGTDPTDEQPAEVEPADEPEPEGLRLMFNDRVIGLDDLADLPENSTILIVAPKDTSHREVTDLLLKVHGAGHLIELRTDD